MSDDSQGLNARQRSDLATMFPGGDCCFDEAVRHVHGADASRRWAMPWAVVRPMETEQVCRLMAWAQVERIPVYSRARATNVVGAAVPERGGVVVSFMKMNRILEINPRDFLAVVEPGVITADLQQAVEAEGLFYPPDPASQAISTIGGNIATCAGGMRAVKYGVTRDYVLGLTVVLPGGKVIRTGGRTHKNVVGLDLTRLMVGSEGTLGLVTRATLKLLPRPGATASVLAGFSSLRDCMGAVDQVFAMGALPTAMEFMGPEVLACLAQVTTLPWPETTRAALLLRLDGSRAALREDIGSLGRVLEAAGATHVLTGLGKDEEEPLWEPRRLINPASFHVAPDKLSDDITLPRGRVAEAVGRLREIGREHGLTILVFGHLGDGNLHVNVMHDASYPDQKQRAEQAKADILDMTLSMEGSMSGEHGVGMVKAPYVHRQLGEEERRLMAAIKKDFDPHSILNPGKSF